MSKQEVWDARIRELMKETKTVVAKKRKQVEEWRKLTEEREKLDEEIKKWRKKRDELKKEREGTVDIDEMAVINRDFEELTEEMMTLEEAARRHKELEDHGNTS